MSVPERILRGVLRLPELDQQRVLDLVEALAAAAEARSNPASAGDDAAGLLACRVAQDLADELCFDAGCGRTSAHAHEAM